MHGIKKFENHWSSPPVHNKFTSLSCPSPKKMTNDEHKLGFGFKSCRVLILGWIWIL